MDPIKQLKALFDKQIKLTKTAFLVNQRLNKVQQEINTLTLKVIKSSNSKLDTEKDLMTEKEVCKLLNKSKATLYRMRTYHDFPYTKIDGQKAIIYSRKAIEAYFNENKQK